MDDLTAGRAEQALDARTPTRLGSRRGGASEPWMLARDLPWRDPERAFASLCGLKHAAWLDGAASGDRRGRLAYIAVDPFSVLAADETGTTLDGAPLGLDPFAAIDACLEPFRAATQPGAFPFTGGAIGMLGYELGRHIERLPARHPNALGIPTLSMGLYDLVLAFDQAERRLTLHSSGLPAAPGAREARAQARADWLVERLDDPPRPIAQDRLAWREELSRAAYEERVSRVLDYIRAGDIFQANFTGRFLAERPAGLDAPSLYRRLRAGSPAPFAAFLDCGPRLAVASASPERFLRLTADGQVETRPIKGTRPRSADPDADAALIAELAASVKDRAENLMIVDLMRNDLGRVCEIGSISVPSLWEVESFASVHHLVSSVTGRLRAGVGPVDLLRATFPGGSITGAPKIRAMEIIDELEGARRGPYCGAIAWIGWDGAMDSSIGIRTLSVTPSAVVAQAGGGIVADSDPGEEYEEMLTKITPLLRALG